MSYKQNPKEAFLSMRGDAAHTLLATSLKQDADRLFGTSELQVQVELESYIPMLRADVQRRLQWDRAFRLWLLQGIREVIVWTGARYGAALSMEADLPEVRNSNGVIINRRAPDLVFQGKDNMPWAVEMKTGQLSRRVHERKLLEYGLALYWQRLQQGHDDPRLQLRWIGIRDQPVEGRLLSVRRRRISPAGAQRWFANRGVQLPLAA